MNSGKLCDVRFDGFAVGFGKADITPDYTTQIPLTGNNDDRRRLSTGQREPIMATCVALTDTDGTTVIVFGMDLHGTDDTVMDEIRKGIEEETGVPAHYIQLGCNHNHQAPNMVTFSLPPVRKYNKEMAPKCVQAAVDALKDRAVAKMYLGIGRPEDMVFTRHFIFKNGEYLGHGGTANARSSEILGHMEKGDNLLQVARFTREGKHDIAIINWQGHPHARTGDPANYTVLFGGGPAIMRQKLLEKTGCESVYLMGGSGNSVQASFIRAENKYPQYEQYGEALADEVIKVFANSKPAQTGKIYYRAEKRLFPEPGQVRPWPICAFGFGDFGYVAEPFETFQSNAIAVREDSPYYMTFYSQVSNGNRVSGYLPDAKAWTYKCYEQGPCFSPVGSGETMQKWLTDMIWDVFQQSGQTVKEKPEGYYRDLTPKCSGVTYDVIADQELKPSTHGHCPLTLLKEGEQVQILAQTEELARKILERKQVKLLFNEQNMTVDIVDS